MAIRQYIGARYVPRFMGTYDPTQIYEALDVVDNGSGTSYISKITTPAGTPLTDNDHWAIYGASSGAILSLQQQIDDMKDGSISGSLQEQINDNASDIEDVSKKVARKFLFVSDSYGARTYNTQTLIELIANRIGITASDYENVQENGSGFIGLGAPRPTFLEAVQAHTFTIPADEITHIVVMGGANDLLESEASLLTAISAFCSYCATTFPNAVIMIGHVGRYWNKTYLNDIVQNSLPAWRKCSLYGATYIKNSEYILHDRTLVEADNVHPSANGVNALAAQIANAILGDGTCDVHYKSTITYDITNGAYYDSNSLSDEAPIHVSVDNEITTLNFGDGTLVALRRSTPATQAQKIPVNDVLTLNHGTNQLVMLGNYADNVVKGISCNSGVRDGSLVTQGNVPASIFFGSNDQCYISVFLYMLNGSWSTLTIGGLDVLINATSITIPSDEC